MADHAPSGATRRALAAAGLLAVTATALGACGSDSGGATPAATSTATTLDPLAGPVVDACGNDLASSTSTVWGIDPVTGAVRWSTSVPLAAPYLLRDDSGDPRLSLVLRPVEAVVDAGTGAVVGYPSAGVHEVLVEPAPDPATGEASLLVDGEAQPPTITEGGLRITTAGGATGQTTVGVTAVDAATGAPAWRVDVGAADAVAAVSPPVVFGTTVVVVTAPPRPSCP